MSGAAVGAAAIDSPSRVQIVTRCRRVPVIANRRHPMPILFTNVRSLPAVDAGAGGVTFSHQYANPGFALVGLGIRAGDWIDQLTPIYAELLDEGAVGPDLYGPSFGGHGGSVHELRVLPGHLVTGIQTRSGDFVDAVRLLQSRWDGTTLSLSDSKWTPWVGGRALGGVERAERILELTGTSIAIGIAGRAARYLDNLTLVGADLVRVAGSTVGKSAGRGPRSTSVSA
jgi:hypothetical protein